MNESIKTIAEQQKNGKCLSPPLFCISNSVNYDLQYHLPNEPLVRGKLDL